MERTRRLRDKLSEEEIQTLLREYAETHSLVPRNQIVEQYRNLVESIARRFLGAGEPVEDLIQEGSLGLISAVDLFDLERGVKFSTFATHFIIGQIKHYLRDRGKIIKEPAWLQELNQRMNRVIESLSQKYGRVPTEQEIAEVMNMDEEQVADLLTTREVFKVSSLDNDKDVSTSFQPRPETIKSDKYVIFQLPIEDKIVLETAMDRLKSIEQRVLYEFFYLDLNQTEIAHKLGISCNYVSHILRNSAKKLKKILVTDELRDTQMQLKLLNLRVQDQTRALEQLTVVDATTRLYNRKYFLERLEEELIRACRHKYPVSTLIISVEPPSTVVGGMPFVRVDELALRTAAAICENVRKVDVVARYAERIFALILPHTGPHSSVVVERLVASIESLEFGRVGNQAICPVVRVGFAIYPQNGRTTHELLDVAFSEAGLEYGEDEISGYWQERRAA